MSTARIRLLLSAAALLGVAAAPAQAQVRFVADKKSSLAWWQVNPHMNHLWATSCPGEPSWRPGEGRSSGWVVGRVFRQPKHGDAAISDTTIVPLYPRRRVRPVCAEALTANVTVKDTTNWTGVSGDVVVLVEGLVTGEDNRDEYAREKILQANQFPEVSYHLDSINEVRAISATTKAMGYGTLTLKGVKEPNVKSSLHFWREAGGLRVLGKLRFPAIDLIEKYGISSFALGLGVGVRMWEHIYLGVDMLLLPAEASASH